MQFRIADTFTSSLARLSNEQQKAAKTTAFDLQVNPTQPSHSLHRVAGAKDPDFWSVRINLDLRIILHLPGGSAYGPCRTWVRIVGTWLPPLGRYANPCSSNQCGDPQFRVQPPIGWFMREPPYKTSRSPAPV